MNKVQVLFWVLSLSAAMAAAETLDVTIKGFDDGKKTSRQ